MFFFFLIFRISDKKEKYNESKLHQRATKSNSCPMSSKVNNHPVLKRSDSINSTSSSCNRENSTHFSDSSNSSSRKNSNTNSPQPCPILELKPESKIESKRSKRKIVDVNRSQVKYEIIQPNEPTIVTEEIRDPWERDLIEKTKLEQKKLKNKHDFNEESQKTKKKSKISLKKESIKHSPLQKEIKNKSDEDVVIEKSNGFKTVENKLKSKKRSDTITPTHHNSGNTLDKLDEISLSGPRPDGKENQRKFLKSEPPKVAKQPIISRKKVPNQFDRDRLMMETPTSPHAIAAAIVDAALVKSQQKKKTKDKGDRLNSGSAFPLSDDNYCNSCNHESNKLNEKARSPTPSGLMHGKCEKQKCIKNCVCVRARSIKKLCKSA